MPTDSRGGLTISTFRDCIEHGYSISAHCQNMKCRRTLDLDVFDMAEHFGLDTHHVKRRFPIKCAACGSRDIGYRMTPDVRNPALWGTRPDNQGKPSRKSIPPHLDLWAKRNQ